MKVVAERYGVSDVALAKTCRKLDVPLPGRGHWAKVAAGQKVKRTPLPPLEEGQTGYLYSQFRRRKDKSDQYGEDARLLIGRESDPEFAVTVSDTLTAPHRLVRQSAKILRMKRVETRERHLAEKTCLDITATGEALERALRIADAILKGAEKRGYQVSVSESAEHRTRDASSNLCFVVRPGRSSIRILDSEIGFSIIEGYDRVELEPTNRRSSSSLGWGYGREPTHKHVPNGRLALKLDAGYFYEGRHTWQDGKKQRVEDCLNGFFLAAIQAAEEERLKRIEDAAREQAEYEAKLRREEAQRRAEQQARLVYDLESRADEWHQARFIEEFLEAVVSNAGAKGTAIPADSELGQWLEWARDYVQTLRSGALDTLLELRPPPKQPPRYGPQW